jgi:putative endonuclease
MAYKEYEFFVYILASKSRTLYIGVTNNLILRLQQHKEGTTSFTSRYKVTRLVYFERFHYIDKAIARETELKHWNRAEKISLIQKHNPTWQDLATLPPKMYTPGEEKSRFRRDASE